MKAKEKERKSVADLEQGEKGIIKHLHSDSWALKLLEMGCIPGTEVSLKYKAPSGGTMCIEVFGHDLSLRAEEARTLTLV